MPFCEAKILYKRPVPSRDKRAVELIVRFVTDPQMKKIVNDMKIVEEQEFH